MIQRRWALVRLQKDGNETDGYNIYPYIKSQIESGAVKGAYSSCPDTILNRFALCKLAWDDTVSNGFTGGAGDLYLLPNLTLDQNLTTAQVSAFRTALTNRFGHTIDFGTLRRARDVYNRVAGAINNHEGRVATIDHIKTWERTITLQYNPSGNGIYAESFSGYTTGYPLALDSEWTVDAGAFRVNGVEESTTQYMETNNTAQCRVYVNAVLPQPRQQLQANLTLGLDGVFAGYTLRRSGTQSYYLCAIRSATDTYKIDKQSGKTTLSLATGAASVTTNELVLMTFQADGTALEFQCSADGGAGNLTATDVTHTWGYAGALSDASATTNRNQFDNINIYEFPIVRDVIGGNGIIPFRRHRGVTL